MSVETIVIGGEQYFWDDETNKVYDAESHQELGWRHNEDGLVDYECEYFTEDE